jgi:hypothetical protein
MKYRELQKELKARGLKSHGTRADLEARWADYIDLDSESDFTVTIDTGFREFVFTGDPNAPGEDPAWCSDYGYMFQLNGRAITVAPEVAVKLANHSHFTEV